MRNEQLIRQWNILLLLDGSSGRSQHSLAEELGCSLRTIQRDLVALSMAGFPITYEVRGHEFLWFVHHGFKKLGVPFTLSELVALSLARNFYSLLPMEGLKKAYQSALSKVEKILPAMRSLQSFSSRPAGRKDYSGHWEKTQLLMEAIRNQNTISMSYFAYGSKQLTARNVDPYDLWHAQETLYLIGYCHLRKDLRLFAVERIQHVEILSEQFETSSDYSLESFTQHRFRVMQEDRMMTIRVRFLPEVADYVQDRIWHPSQRFEKRADGSIVLTMDVAGSTEILNWVFGYGPNAEILEPISLRKKAASRTRRMLRLYDAVPKPGVKRARSVKQPTLENMPARKTAT